MSTLTDKAKAEADEAEANEPNEEEEEAEGAEQPQPEPEPEPEQPTAPPAMTEQQAEREFAKLEKKAQTYLEGALAIASKLEIPVQPCPLCTFPGLAIPRTANEVTSDVEGAVLALIGKAVEPDYKESQAYRRCEACDGWGDVLTGAKKDVSRTAMCVACGGKGFVNQVVAAPQTQAGNGVALPVVVPNTAGGYEPPRPEPYYDYGERQWKLPPQPIGG